MCDTGGRTARPPAGRCPPQSGGRRIFGGYFRIGDSASVLLRHFAITFEQKKNKPVRFASNGRTLTIDAP
jgi:hypothetical protein